MENLTIQTTQNIDIVHGIAGIGDRILASILDYLFRFCYMILIIGILGVLNINSMALIIILIFVPLLLYHLICEIVFNGQSLGKKIMKIRVVMLDGSQPTFMVYFIRWLLRIVDIMLTWGVVAILTIIFSGKGQRLGDLAAGTTVVKLAPPVTLEKLTMVVDDNYQPIFREVVNLTEKDINIIRELINFYKKDPDSNDAKNMLKKARTGVQNKLGINSTLNDFEFIATIFKDYNAINK